MNHWRTSLNRHPVITGIVAGIVILAAVLYYYRADLFRPGRIVKQSPHAYYIDEQTGEETVEPATAVPPLPNAEGKPTRVRAYFFSADGGKTRVAGYYEKYSAQAKTAIETLPPDQLDQQWQMIDLGHLVRRPAAGSPWVWVQSEEGQRIRASPSPDPSKPLLPCFPP